MLRRVLLILACLLALPAQAGTHVIAGGGHAVVAVTAPFTPWQMPPALRPGWWSAEDHGTGLMTDDNPASTHDISSWSSRGSALALTAAGSARPQWSASGMNSAYQAVNFDGTAMCLTNAAFSSVLPNGATSGEIWVVGQAVNRGSVTLMVSYGGTSGATARALRYSSGARLQVSDASTNVTDTGNDLVTSPFIAHGTWSGTAMNGYMNANGFSTNPNTIASLNTGTARLRVGSNNGASCASFYQGGISEVLVVAGISANITLPGTSYTLDKYLQGYFAWHYGFPSALPSGHPFRSTAP